MTQLKIEMAGRQAVIYCLLIAHIIGTEIAQSEMTGFVNLLFVGVLLILALEFPYKVLFASKRGDNDQDSGSGHQ